MALRRVEGWETRLAAHFTQHRAAAFAYGWNDCTTFVGEAVRAIDPAFAWRPDWHDEDTALRAIARAGGLVAGVSAVLGTPIEDWRKLRRGDVALAEQPDGTPLLVCTGRTLCGPGPGVTGLQNLPLPRAVKVWPIG
jgi:hypothetical protein